MRIHFQVTSSDASRARTFFELHRDSPFVRARIERNLRGHRRPLTPARVWLALVACLLTTQQRSGPQSSVARFLRLRPAPLSLLRCRRAGPRLARYVEVSLGAHGGIRRTSIISAELEANLRWLDDEGWGRVLPLVHCLAGKHTPQDERTAAEELARGLRGLGPKQSRNLLQSLGVTQHEVPIDSRVTKWLRDFGFPIGLSAVALSDPEYYAFVSEGFQALCAKAKVAPCAMDAAIFSSFDQVWAAEDVVF
mgnify:CR=1 FL=1